MTDIIALLAGTAAANLSCGDEGPTLMRPQTPWTDEDTKALQAHAAGSDAARARRLARDNPGHSS